MCRRAEDIKATDVAKKVVELESEKHKQKRDYYNEVLIPECGIGESSVVLDIGTQYGNLAGVAAGYTDNTVYGIDISGKNIEVARQYWSGRYSNLDFQNQDAVDLHFGDDSIDIVISSWFFIGLLSHTRIKVLREIHRVLKDGGRLGILAYAGEKGDYCWTREEWLRYLEEAGFVDISVEHPVSEDFLGQMVREPATFVITAKNSKPRHCFVADAPRNDSFEFKSIVIKILRSLQDRNLGREIIPWIPIEGTAESRDVLETLIEIANISDKDAEEIFVNLIAKGGEGLEQYIREAMDSIPEADNKTKLEYLIQKAKVIKQAETQAMSLLGDVPVEGIDVGIIDAHILINMGEIELRRALDLLTSNPKKAIAVVVFDKKDEGILRVIDASKITVVKAGEIGAELPEEAAIEKIKKERFSGQEVPISDVSVLVSLENIIRGRWRTALSRFHYVILNNRSLTNTALLNMYKGLPDDIKAHLKQAGLNVEVIKRSTLQEEKLGPERYEKNAITEIGKSA